VGWLLGDHLGSVRDIADNGGVVIDHVDYDAWGNVVAETHPEHGDVLKFAGYWKQIGVGLYQVWHRWYDPNTARWMTQDMKRYDAGDTNLQRYVSNDSTNAIDPTGTELFAYGKTAADAAVAWIQAETGAAATAVKVNNTKKDLSSIPYASCTTINDDVYYIRLPKSSLGVVLQHHTNPKLTSFDRKMYSALTSWSKHEIVYENSRDTFRLAELNLFSDFNRTDLAKVFEALLSCGYSGAVVRSSGGITADMMPKGPVELRGTWKMRLQLNYTSTGTGHAWVEFTRGDVTIKVSSGPFGNVPGFLCWNWNNDELEASLSCSTWVNRPIIAPALSWYTPSPGSGALWGVPVPSLGNGPCTQYAIDIWNNNSGRLTEQFTSKPWFPFAATPDVAFQKLKNGAWMTALEWVTRKPW
jgi:RHS repeat-associated protein